MVHDPFASEICNESKSVRIGNGIAFHSNGQLFRAKIYISSSASLCLVIEQPMGLEIDKLREACCSAIQDWSIADLNSISANHFYESMGQELYVIDALARAGFLTYSDGRLFADALERTLHSREINVVLRDPSVCMEG